MFFFSCVPSSFSPDCLEGICRIKREKEKKEILAITYITSPHAFSRYMLALCTYCEVLFLEYCAVEFAQHSTCQPLSRFSIPLLLSRDLTPSSSVFPCVSGSEIIALLLFKQINIITDEMSLHFHVNVELIFGLLTCVYMIKATSIIVAVRHVS